MATHTPCFILSAEQILSRIDELSDVLEQCVNDGASVSFMLPFNRDKSRPFWTRVAQSVSCGERIVLGAENAQGTCRRCQTSGSYLRTAVRDRPGIDEYTGNLRTS